METYKRIDEDFKQLDFKTLTGLSCLQDNIVEDHNDNNENKIMQYMCAYDEHTGLIIEQLEFDEIIEQYYHKVRIQGLKIYDNIPYMVKKNIREQLCTDIIDGEFYPSINVSQDIFEIVLESLDDEEPKWCAPIALIILLTGFDLEVRYDEIIELIPESDDSIIIELYGTLLSLLNNIKNFEE